MKKVLSLVLILALMLSSVLMISCGGDDSTTTTEKVGVTEEDFKADAQVAVNNALNNTTKDFFALNTGFGKVALGALNKGSVSVGFSNGTEGDYNVSGKETIFIDAANGKFVSDTKVTVDGDEITGQIFFDKNGFVVKGEDILGSDKALLLNFSTFVEKFTDSELADVFGLSEADKEQFNAIVAEVKAALENKNSGLDVEKLMADIQAKADKYVKATVSSETVDAIDCVVVTYTVTKDDILSLSKELVDVIVDLIPDEMMTEMDLGSKADLKTMAKEMIDEAFADITMTMTSKIFVVKDTNKVLKETADCTMTYPTYEYRFNDETWEYEEVKVGDCTVKVNTEMKFTSSEISMKVDCDVAVSEAEGEEPISKKLVADAKITKTVTGDETKFNAEMSFTQGTVSVKPVTGYLTYNKSTGNVVLSVDVMADEEVTETVNLTLNGNIKVEEKKASAKLTSVTFDGETYNFELSVEFAQLDTIPTAPADAKDVVELTQEEIMAIMEEFQNSTIGKMLFGDPTPDYDVVPF